MIISHKHKFIFIKTVKTAGTSLEVFLSQHCGPLDVVTPIIPHVEPHLARNHEGYYNHMPAFQIRHKIDPQIWRSYFKFCVERNPWDKTLSFYHMENHRRQSGVTLDNFLAEKKFPLNYPWYTEPDNPNKIIVDRIIHYEQLIPELAGVFQDLGIAFYGTLGVNAKSEYRTDRRPYQEIYSPEQARLIGDSFQQEILLHGYKY
jgi:hypothetical protein